MIFNTKKLLIVTSISLALTACGDDGSDGQDFVTAAPSDITIEFGGRLAQDFLEETEFSTNVNELVAGTPAEFEADEDDVRPGPPSVGADIPVTYFGPAPSDSNPNLIGPVQLLTAGVVDTEQETATVTLPLYEGLLASGGPKDGQRFWYIVTDTSDPENAEALGLNFSAKLAFTDVSAADSNGFTPSAVRRGYYDNNGVLVTEGGAVDFSSVRSVSTSSTDTSGTNNLLDVLNATPGAIGTDNGDEDGFYSPLVKIENARNHIYNAPMVSFNTDEADLSPYCDGISEDEEEAARAILHDSVVSICPGEDGEPGTVTMELTLGFSFGRPVLYLSTDTSAAGPAALEAAIYAPALANIAVGADDSLFSGVERIFGFTNGPVNVNGEVNPQRQGFNSALSGEGLPLNVLGGIPTVATDYSPLWDLNLGEWTEEAIDNGYRSRLTEEFSILGMVERGFLTGPGGSTYGSSGVIINCPIVQRLL
ncbi:DUF7482 domain-containing protein [Psychromonas sp. L1A2]|uniref:DUF7482 domain-containing protein n=1 Tax=Psychromonas sp. L1A2 TaxID=2686356 RepID=UPI0013567CF4|nr:hypothetical protein [Psychromonas sp. L1A2]